MAIAIPPDILEPLGFKKNEATVLSYMINMKKAISMDIEHACYLRQPEVCVVLGELADEKLVTITKQKKEGKGRPTHIYHINGKIFGMLELKLKQRQKDLESEIEELGKISKILKRNA